ncbi:ABC transporter substrate-binding protein, partial [Escherichia coli]|nr:ABC transporter substrate-binding protein [Escherichia coli]
IREGVTFHNGQPLGAASVANSLQRAIDSTPVPRILNGTALDVEVLGEHGLRITTANPDPLLPQRLSSPQLAIFAPEAYTDSGVDPAGHGTGPFQITGVDGMSGATLDRYEDYWGDKAAAAGIDVKFVPDGT